MSGNISFMNKFPFLRTLLGAEFYKDNFVKYHYIEHFGIEQEEQQEHMGSTTIIIENDLESILLDHNYTIKSKRWITKTYWEVEDVIISNLYTLIVQFNTENYYDKKFKS